MEGHDATINVYTDEIRCICGWSDIGLAGDLVGLYEAHLEDQ